VRSLRCLIPIVLSVFGALSNARAAENCPAALKADELLSGKYRLALVAIGKNTAKKLDVDTFYFFNGKCECSFGAPPNEEFGESELTSAARSKNGMRKLVARIEDIKGQCPSVKNRWSPSLQCYDAKSPTCKEAMN